MIKIENCAVSGFEHAIRGMRNPMNSWERSDSEFDEQGAFEIGQNDHALMMSLAKGGAVHAKYKRMINVYADVTAPLYWWKEFDTYKIGTVANSCSTMHKIHSRDLTLKDFSVEHLSNGELGCICAVIDVINDNRRRFLKTKNKDYWWQMIQLLPASYNQKRTVMLNYEVLTNIYTSRKNHKLDEWHEFCDWIEKLPCSEVITG